MAYCSATETHATGTQTFKHIYFIKSEDGGDSWSDPVDGTPDEEYIGYEAVYPSLAEDVDNHLHLVYQRDLEPGIHAFGEADPVDLNDIIYLQVTTDLDFTGVEEGTMAVGLFPNPAQDLLQVHTESPIRIWSVTDVSGKVVLSGSGPLTSLNTQSLTPGVYVLSAATAQGMTRASFVKA
jgi:hypothetical protein